MLVILGIDHVGLATNDAAGAGVFLTALGMRRTESGVAGDYGVACDFWECPAAGEHPVGHCPTEAASRHPAIEMVSPIRDDSSITERLAQNSGGLYHIAFRVDDIQAEIARLRDSGFVAIDSRPHPGARRGMQVAFMYAKKPACLVVELVQYQEG
jgi:methylmalonyl-CoA/ethylmalonyl-CoA epimerase